MVAAGIMPMWVRFYMKRFPSLRQLDDMDSGPTCLRMIARHHGKIFDAHFLRERCLITRAGVSLAWISEAAEAIGMNSPAVHVSSETLGDEMPLPYNAHTRGNSIFVVVHAFFGDSVHVAFARPLCPRREVGSGETRRACRRLNGRLVIKISSTPRIGPCIVLSNGRCWLLLPHRPLRFNADPRDAYPEAANGSFGTTTNLN